jgi:hypothetical protein
MQNVLMTHFAISIFMSPERESAHITFEEVIANAKEVLFRDGNHVPVLIVDANKSLLAGQIPDLPPSHGERVALMRLLGQAAALSGSVDQLNQVFMVSEGWMSEPSEGQPTDLRPSQDPHRKEVLIISAIEIKERKKNLKILEISRDSDAKVVGLEEILPENEKKDETVDVPLLDAFVQGFQTAFRIRYN